jgi:hypothetical protein
MRLQWEGKRLEEEDKECIQDFSGNKFKPVTLRMKKDMTV